jgi:hypothetical protein
MPGMEDFDKMSVISKGSIKSKVSVPLKFNSNDPNSKEAKKPLVFIDVNLGKDKGK